MIVELVLSRGVGLYINGNTPDSERWGVGGDTDDDMTFSSNGNPWITFGDINVSGLKIITGHWPEAPDGFWSEDSIGLPVEIVLDTDGGPIRVPVTDVVIGPDTIYTKRKQTHTPDSIAANMNDEIDSGSEYSGLEDNDEFAPMHEVPVTLENGKTRGIDETMAYVRAES